MNYNPTPGGTCMPCAGTVSGNGTVCTPPVIPDDGGMMLIKLTPHNSLVDAGIGGW
jgi:hypothetical protein